MYRINCYLLLAMGMSMLWGVFVLLIGLVLRYGMGQLIASYVEDVEDVVDLRGTKNAAGRDICPVETEPTNNLNLGEWTTIIGSLVVSTGTLIVIYSTTGFVAAILRSTLLMLLLLFIIVVVCGLEYYIFQVSTDIYNTFHDSSRKELVSILHSDYTLTEQSNMFSKTMNAIMLKTQCCGILGPEDFGNLTFVEDVHNTWYFTVSPACCKKSLFKNKPEVTFELLKDCAKTGSYNVINNVGCYAELFSYVSYNYGTQIIVGLIVLVLWQIVQVVLIILMLFTPPKVEKRLSILAPPAPSLPHKAEPKPKKFTPYWKVSSYFPDDLARIRSTEIW